MLTLPLEHDPPQAAKSACMDHGFHAQSELV